MEVKINEIATVYPSKQPFDHDHVLSLSHLDNDRNLCVPFRYLRAYVSTDPKSHPSDPFEVIRKSLAEVLVPYYPYTGSLRRCAADGRLELFCAVGKGVPVIRATVDATLESLNYLDDPDENFVEKLVFDPNPEEGLEKPFALQLTEFACGGWCLGATLHHSLCDGMGATQFFNNMAELARGATKIPIEPVWDRSSLLGPRDPPRVEFPVHEFLSLDKSFSPYTSFEGSVVKGLFHAKDATLDRFKEWLRERSGSNYTTFEALGAYIWRARVKACQVPDDEKVKFVYSMNMRKLLRLPFGYWGNGCTPMYVQINAKDLLEQPIWETAELIKKGKHNACDEYVRSFIDFQELNYEKGITGGKGVSGFTDWRHLGHSTVDFGWGGPVTVLPLTRSLLGSVEPCYFLPYSSATAGKKDGFKVQVSLRETAMPVFKAEMEKFSRNEFD